MVSPLRLPQPNKILQTLEYFDKYDYPLTKEELIYWSGSKVLSKPQNDYFFLPGRQKLVAIRLQREKISQAKWQMAKQVGEKLKKFGFIQAVFITGSLAMNNTKEDDDIDLMIVTKPNTLWITRFFVNIYLSTARRYPGQQQTSNKICPNLWLNEYNLATNVHGHSLYQAHEVLQAKMLWDRNNIANKFLAANSWVKDYLPNAYKHLTPPAGDPLLISGEGLLLKILNLVFFWLQYLYMKSKMTTERVGLGFAFFHPNKHE